MAPSTWWICSALAPSLEAEGCVHTLCRDGEEGGRGRRGGVLHYLLRQPGKERPSAYRPVGVLTGLSSSCWQQLLGSLGKKGPCSYIWGRAPWPVSPGWPWGCPSSAPPPPVESGSKGTMIRSMITVMASLVQISSSCPVYPWVGGRRGRVERKKEAKEGRGIRVLHSVETGK